MTLARQAAGAFCLLGLVLASACGGGGDGGSSTRPAVEEAFSYDVNVGTQTALRLVGVSGTVTVSGAAGGTSSISITGERRVEADTLEEATAQLAALRANVTSSMSEVLVETDQPQFAAGRNYIVNYTIVLPEHLNVSVTNLNGNVTVRSLNADCTITNMNGGILADAIAGNAVLSLANGDITAWMTLPPGGRIEIGVVNGTIDLAIPQTTSTQFSATVATGSITLTNLSLAVPPGSPCGTQACSGTLGSGNGTIDLHAGNGAIAVRGV